MAQMTTGIDGQRDRGVALHPLDPLTPAELEAVVEAVRSARALDHRHLFVTVQLDEPAKEAVVDWREGDALDRVARVAVWDQQAATVSEGTVSVTGEVRSWQVVPGAKAPALIPQAIAVIEAVKADPRVREGLRKRGITNLDDLHVEPWPYGSKRPAALDDGRRLAWTPMWHRLSADDNAYAHPIAGLHAIVDADTGEVIDVEDHGVRPVPQEPGHFRQSQLAAPRTRQRARHQAAGRAGLHGRRLAGAMAEVVAAGRFLPARGARGPRRTLRRRRRRAAHRAPAVDRRARHPVRRSQSGQLPQERLRHGRGRHGLLHQLARAGLRLPRRDPLPRRVGGRRRRRGADDPERHLPARGGPRHPLEAHRPDGHVEVRRSRRLRGLVDRRPSTTTSTATTGTSARTARSSSRPS